MPRGDPALRAGFRRGDFVTEDLGDDDIRATHDGDGKGVVIHLFNQRPCQKSCQLARKIFDRCQDLADVRTRLGAKPSGWTALHCLSDCANNEAFEHWGERMAWELLAKCSWETVNARTDKQSTSAHLAVRRGLLGVIKALKRDSRREILQLFIIQWLVTHYVLTY